MIKLCIANRLFSKIYFCMIAEAVKIHFQSRKKLVRNPNTPRVLISYCMIHVVVKKDKIMLISAFVSTLYLGGR